MSKVCSSGFFNWIAAVIAGTGVAGAGAADMRYNGAVGVEHRYYFEAPQYPQQRSAGSWSYFVEPELSWQSRSREHQFRLVPFMRVDSVDGERSHGDVREAYWRWSGDELQLLAGVQQVFWGVAESRHLVDVLNQTDLVEDPDQEQKLGQPMLQLSSLREWGEWSVFLLPWFRERTFAGEKGRFRTPVPVDVGEARFESGRENRHWDIAARYSHVIGDWDIGVHVFDGTSREPRLLFENGRLIPVYDQMRQLGVDLQYTRDAFLYKFELLGRRSRGEEFGAAVFGLEYTLFQVSGSDKDLGFLVEYLYDSRSAEFPVTPFDDDIFLGTRLSFNDVQDSAMLFGVIYDPDTGEAFYNLEAERRLGRSFKLELRARFIEGAEGDDVFFSLERDDYLQLQFSYHF